MNPTDSHPVSSGPDLPRVIQGYFAADRDGDIDALANCFAADAVVRDEGRDHVGIDAILAWKAGTSRAYSYTATPFAILDEEDRAIVTSHLVGDFPGSPVDLRYIFRLVGDRIAALEIRP
ncbi:MAG: nuclear transport factor 2 family protein [Pseudomonadota bacterium]